MSLPRVTEEAPMDRATANLRIKHVSSTGLVHRPSTKVLSLNSSDSIRRKSFFVDLQEQMQKHQEDDLERERQKETLLIHRILQRPPENRDTADIDVLYDWVMRNGSTIKIFQGAQEIICKTICREMTLLELPATGVVCYQGDYGDVFFIIISGSVSLYVETKKKAFANNNNQGDEPKGSDRFRLQRTSTGLSDNPKNEFNPEMYGMFIKQIGAGGTFGELAVMDPTARRSCTIICDVPTSFICLKRAAYQRLIRITNSSQLDFTQVEFLETLFFFERWPHGELMRLSNRLRHMTFPADSHLARISSEANLIFFIYSGTVQETIPLVHHLNDNGTIAKCTTLESESALRSTLQNLTLADRKLQQQRRRVALEVNLYQEHDICGEYPIIFNKAASNTDLLAVTDVKVLIMDRETWREVFYMHGLEHVRESHKRFRQLAQARENWRQTRLKLELANPGLHMTLSTKAMMQDAKCMCGWCGSRDHITGDTSCPSLVASKQRQADKQKKREAEKSSPSHRRAKTPNGGNAPDSITTRANVVKNTLTFVSQLQQNISHRKASAIAMGLDVADLSTDTGAVRPTTPRTPSGNSRSGTSRQSSLRTAAQRIMSANSHKRHDLDDDQPPTQPPVTPVEEVNSSTRKKAIIIRRSVADDVRRQTTDLYQVSQAARIVSPVAVIVPPKAEEVRKSAFTEELSLQYRQELVRKAKRITKVQEFFDTRGQVLEQIQHEDAELPEERHERKLPRKPKIPKPCRRLAMCSKNREARPDRFNRKINRMLKKMWIQDHPVPVVEESLRDS